MIVRITEQDLNENNEYIHSDNIRCNKLEIGDGLGDVKVKGSIHSKSYIRIGSRTNLIVGENINSGGFISSLGGITSGGYIASKEFIYAKRGISCGKYIDSVNYISSEKFIYSGEYIYSGGGIYSVEYIYSGEGICSIRSISTGGDIYSGRYISAEELIYSGGEIKAKTTIVAKEIKGKVVSGEVRLFKENTMDNYKQVNDLESKITELTKKIQALEGEVSLLRINSKMNNVFLVGRLLKPPEKIWEVLGIYTSLDDAIKRCTCLSDFIWKTNLNEDYPEDMSCMTNVTYPLWGGKKSIELIKEDLNMLNNMNNELGDVIKLRNDIKNIQDQIESLYKKIKYLESELKTKTEIHSHYHYQGPTCDTFIMADTNKQSKIYPNVQTGSIKTDTKTGQVL